jgi:hypothetical protein
MTETGNMQSGGGSLFGVLLQPQQLLLVLVLALVLTLALAPALVLVRLLLLLLPQLHLESVAVVSKKLHDALYERDLA